MELELCLAGAERGDGKAGGCGSVRWVVSVSCRMTGRLDVRGVVPLMPFPSIRLADPAHSSMSSRLQRLFGSGPGARSPGGMRTSMDGQPGSGDGGYASPVLGFTGAGRAEGVLGRAGSGDHRLRQVCGHANCLAGSWHALLPPPLSLLLFSLSRSLEAPRRPRPARRAGRQRWATARPGPWLTTC